MYAGSKFDLILRQKDTDCSWQLQSMTRGCIARFVSAMIANQIQTSLRIQLLMTSTADCLVENHCQNLMVEHYKR